MYAQIINSQKKAIRVIMAMSPRTPTFRTQQPSPRPVYENVLPKSEMKETEEAYLLHIQLPGFTKERIRITFVGSSRMLRVAGERPIVGSNRWSRLDQTYPVPENCEVDRLDGKFEHGILTVTMPKKLISQVTPKAEVIPQKSTTNRVEEPIGDRKSPSLPSTNVKDLKEIKGAQKDNPRGKRPNEISQKHEDDKGLRALIPPEPFKEPRPQNVQEVEKEKITAATPGKPKKGQKEIEAKLMLTMDPRKQIDEKRQEEIRQKTILATVKKQLNEKEGDMESVKKKEVKEEDGLPYKSRKPEKDMDQMALFKGKEIRTRKYSPKAAEPSAPKAPEKDTIRKRIGELAASASQVVIGIGEGKLNDQEKPLVANIGAAILVISALGAYVFYKFSSSDRT